MVTGETFVNVIPNQTFSPYLSVEKCKCQKSKIFEHKANPSISNQKN